ncbi:hypothetical protein CH333_04060 [candidate division WOR-3 bacterium JGI_Cruoil_03_44_89]|uniref:Peptidase S8/S53 domain-containing protein n=1 Tax=candidate division WOR-3 bacterium JGI_Cruoil_03_44_89 TaxID=1973748 RepID=A0A235BUR9_UNCW3|nr:MAG: hypothetical protein CH333_04060 [candidate division WOR-3 bacterium JGI_Cruoil_03_44_89]
MKKLFIIFAALVSLISITNAELQEESGYHICRASRKRAFVSGEAIVCMSADVRGGMETIPSRNALKEKFGVYSIERLTRREPDNIEKIHHLDRLYLFRFSKEEPVANFINYIARDDAIEYAQPNFLYKLFCDPNDSLFAEQWNLRKAKFTDGWDHQTGDPLVTIAMVDAGLDWSHPDLCDNTWVNPGEDLDGDGVVFDSDDLNGEDDDGNGYIDDLIGWDWTHDDNDPAPTFTGEDHGTLCGGIANAVTNNNEGIAGAAYNCKLIALRCTHPEEPLSISTWAAICAIVYARVMGADVINMSWGSCGYDNVLNDVIQASHLSGMVITASAGTYCDSSVICYPAGYENVIAVTATDSSDRKLGNANYGDWIDVCAPGQDIYSTIPEGGYGLYSGTSVAAPQVAALVALLRAQNPDSSNFWIEHRIFETCDNIDSLNPGYEGKLGHGRINALEALSSVGIEGNNQAIKRIKLRIHPNPAFSSLELHYAIPSSQEVVLRIYDISGGLVKELVNDSQNKGNHAVIWGAKDLYNKRVRNGIYFVVLKAGRMETTEKVVVLH